MTSSKSTVQVTADKTHTENLQTHRFYNMVASGVPPIRAPAGQTIIRDGQLLGITLHVITAGSLQCFI